MRAAPSVSSRHPKTFTEAAVSNRSKTRALFDHFVGAQQESFRYFKTER